MVDVPDTFADSDTLADSTLSPTPAIPETITSVGKNVMAKCYRGRLSRKLELFEKQKKGKVWMKRIGKVDVPQGALMAVPVTGK